MADVEFDKLAEDSPLGDVRMLIPDTEQLSNPLAPTEPKAYLFSDVMITRLLRINAGNVRRAAADACEALGTNELMILKKITTSEGLSTDGSVLAKEYGAKANRLRAQADKADDDDNDDGGGFIHLGYTRQPIPFDAASHMPGDGNVPWLR